jgi:hypothetical protein
LSPTTVKSYFEVTDFREKIFRIISGPMPEGSPIVNNIFG